MAREPDEALRDDEYLDYVEEERRQREHFESIGRFTVSGQPLDFNISIRAGRVGKRGWHSVDLPRPSDPLGDERLRWQQVMREAFADAVQEQMTRITPDVEWRAQGRAPGDTAGPGEDIIAFAVTTGAVLWAVTKAMDFFNTWVEFGRNLRSALPRVRDEFGAQPHLASGTAMVLGAAALHDETSRSDFSFAFSAPMSAHPPSKWGEHDGFAVGFRSSDELRVIAIDLDGELRASTCIELPGRLPAWWQEYESRYLEADD